MTPEIRRGLIAAFMLAGTVGLAEAKTLKVVASMDNLAQKADLTAKHRSVAQNPTRRVTPEGYNKKGLRSIWI